MLKLNNLKPGRGARRSSVRRGRGPGSGSGGTAGRGHKGDRARSGTTVRVYFEGGQTPLTRRSPKRGFTSPFKVCYQIVNVGDLSKIDVGDKEIDAKVLYEHGLIRSPDKPVKILGGGELDKQLVVKADAYSASAREKLKMSKATVR
jgi:large subunit ribosomal protein L15